MNVLHGRGNTVRSRAKRSSGTPLDPEAYEAIERFARLMVRCGYDIAAIAKAFGLSLAASRNESPPSPHNARDVPGASHLVTLWCTSPDYVDELGNPVPLPQRGSRRSLQSLTRRIDRTLDVADVLQYLIRTRTVRKVGRKYVLNRRWIMLRGVSGWAHSHGIRVLAGKLRTLEHNLVADADTRSWFEFAAENPRFPVSQLEAFDKLLRRTGLGSLRKLDGFMRHCEANRRPTEPTVWLGVAMHEFQRDNSGVFVSRTGKRTKRRATGRPK
jgi:hypothetical protein